VVIFVIFAALCYAFSSTIGFNIFDSLAPQAVAITLVLFATVRALLARQSQQTGGTRGVMLVAIFAMVAVMNCAISWNPLETILRWGLWFILIILLTKMGRSSTGKWMEVTIEWLPYLFFITYIALILFAHKLTNETDISVSPVMHLTGLVGNMILATGLFASSLLRRILWSVLGFFVIFRSGAGGALFTIPISFIPFILYSTTSVPIKGVAVATMLLLGAAVFYNSTLFTRFLNIKVGGDSTESYSGLERLENSGQTRLLLVQIGLEISRDNPLGTGLGDTYFNIVVDEAGMSHVHNGTISMLIELGYLGFAVYVGVLAWVFLTILTNPAIENRKKAFYFTYYFTIFGRSLSENYSPFDLGNFYNMVFLLLTGYLFLYPRVVAVRPPAFAPAPGPMGMRPPLPMHPPPPMRPPLRPPPPGQPSFPPPPRARQPWGPPVSMH
jgi:hypothetical protein